VTATRARRSPGDGAARARRGGNVLVLFALLSFALLGLLALVVDLGIARGTQGRMQAACDRYAMEGVWERDAALDDADRRDRVLASLAGDVDASGAPALDAGPRVAVTGGVTELDALADVALGSDPATGEPVFALGPGALADNDLNAPAGDLVAGDYDPDGSHVEAPDYTRADLDTSVPPGGADAFLVRLRRVSPRDAVPADSGPGATALPPVPYLFGRGTLLAGDVRANGVTVRATAIARAVPAIRVGFAVDADGDGLPDDSDGDGEPDVPGLLLLPNGGAAAGLALTRAFWLGLAAPTPVDFDGSGEAPGAGRLLPDPGLAGAADAVGRDISSPAPPALTAFELVGYVPLYVAGDDRVVGFGRARVRVVDADTVEVTRLAGGVAPRNAGATYAGPAPAAGADLEAALAVRAALVADGADPVLAAARVR